MKKDVSCLVGRKKYGFISSIHKDITVRALRMAHGLLDIFCLINPIYLLLKAQLCSRG